MKEQNSLYVIGHKITPAAVTGDYDMVIGETGAGVQGPPPHLHNGYHEVFLVMEGEMDFVIDGQPQKVKAGESVNLPPNTTHTFSNNSDNPCKWVNIHSPKGFLSFFETMGVPTSVPDALAKSVAESVIQKVISECSNYDMHIQG